MNKMTEIEENLPKALATFPPNDDFFISGETSRTPRMPYSIGGPWFFAMF